MSTATTNTATRLATSGQASQGAWQLAWASAAGSRHIEEGKPCEDSLAHRFHPQGCISLAAADGVSGGAVGHEASYAAARHCADWACPPISAWAAEPTSDATLTALQTHVQQLDAVVRQAVAQHTARTGATTLAAAWLQADGSGWLCHVGDVRAYTWSPGLGSASASLDSLTRDQTYTALCELPSPGVPPDNPARMLGNGSGQNPALQTLNLALGQALLLVTDGLHGFVTNREMDHLLAQHLPAQPSPAHLSSVARHLLRQALQQGSDDDIAVMLLTRTPIAQ